MSFVELGLSDKVLKAAEAAGYTSPTPIQEQAIPHVLARKDVLGIAQTGTGKTAAFTLPMLTLLENGRARARMPRTLVLEPTRELAAQVEENFNKYGSQHKLSVALLIGGVSFGDQDAKITRGADVLIATPGRLLDHFERGKLLLTGVELLVIDEADRMLDMGFIPDIERIVKLVPFTRQTLFFSATMPPEIQKLADAFLHNPVRIEVARAASTANTITQLLVSTGHEPHQKRATLRDLIRDSENLKNGIIFCNRKRDVATLHRSLVRHGFGAVALHGDMDQRARMQALDGFRNNEFALLVASDVAARGLDIPDVSHVFNYDVPFHAEDYVHRIGRTGRAGRSGVAYSLVARGDEKSLAAIESLIKRNIDWQGKPLAERTDEDDSYSAPDRGEGWRRGGDDRRGGRNRNKRRGKGGDRERGHEHRARNESDARPSEAPRPLENARRDEQPRREDHQRRDHQRRDDQRRDDRRDHHRRRDRYDNEPDVSVIGFGDHVPAFLQRQIPSSVYAPLPNENQAARKPVTPVSMPPRDIPDEVEAPVKVRKSEPRNKAEAVEAVAMTAEKPKKTRARKVKGEPVVEATEPAVAPVKEKKTRTRAPAKKAEAKIIESVIEKADKPKTTRRKVVKAEPPEGDEAAAKKPAAAKAKTAARKPAAKKVAAKKTAAKKVPA